ncbi:metallo-beta-lactamase family protein [Novosphingobium kunmingense]|uniref:Metallo-beta-lactamase family protein n=1 Tax=Novosphingobium kunmingense TaxID=1211806 RepID=A0A2N0HJD3_9SPHN|nr:MBL fold metallo-hydrolase [Novosphingobium kunmingense]PKB19041.1 metallo-beta-lactamase family protein [Novosphingobium kunmingense]
MTLSLAVHGAARTVTGSCLELRAGGSRILLDCGLFQGSRSLEALNYEALAFEPSSIDAVVLSHAHIDHSGLLPRLVAEGFSGTIWCTIETSDLLEFMLADAGRIQEYEAERRNHRRDRAGDELIAPIYTEADALVAWQRARAVPLAEWFEPAPGFRVKLWNAGHILGSASVEVEAGGVRLLYSGDIGPDNKAFHADPDSPTGFDHVICEATYGDRSREQISIEARRRLLETEIVEARARGGNLVIPTFALERTQELLLDISKLSSDDRIGTAAVFVDSPLANRATTVFRKYADQLEDTGGRDVFAHPSIHYVNDVSGSMMLNSTSGAIILAASGMCEAGRIRHHLFYNLPRRESTILFVGFQAEGSLGRVILDGAKRVRISGRDVMVRAQIRRIESYSAHADQAELLAWIEARAPIGGTLFLGHGERGAIDELGKLVTARGLAPSVIVPEIGEVYELNAGAPARRTKTGKPELQEAIGRDWQNNYADLATSLKRRLANIRDARDRQTAIDEMRRVLDSYSAPI